MPNKEEEFFETIKVVKRNGSKVSFNGTKIAMAIKKGFDISYIKHFVRSFEFNRVLVGSSILGASIVRRNFDSVAFDNWKLKLPSLEEQQKIAAILNTADREIELLAEKLDHLKTEKRALMQQLLTGKRRVKVDG